MNDENTIIELRKLVKKELTKDLKMLSERFPGEVVFSTSFSVEDQIITDQIFSLNLPIKVFTLDTGRLFPETYSTWSETSRKYGKTIQAFYPDNNELEKFISENGPNCFYESVQNRMRCCELRKVMPLQRALKNNKVWITGIRHEHSPNRSDMEQLEWDIHNKLIKFHPLFYWDSLQVANYIKNHQIPTNPLHEKGFQSIGCAPCTRATKPGEDIRAGRWWWEDNSKKECGLHIHTK